MHETLWSVVAEMLPALIFKKSLCHRNVTDTDILALERRLLQTMDMIVSKKKR